MEQAIQTAVTETFERSNAGRIHFGQGVANLLDVGVESYHVDYRAGRATYYWPDGATFTLSSDAPEAAIADRFSAVEIKAAIAGAQRGDVLYPEFKKLSQAGGCIGYTVWLSGRHVSYYGRNGETHLEKFPD